MDDRSRSLKPLTRFVARGARNGNDPAAPPRIDWPTWLRVVERKRRLYGRLNAPRPLALPDHYFAAATYISFRLEGLDVSEQQVLHALGRGAAGREFRSRPEQRLRNHVALLLHMETSIRLGESLKVGTVVRWYTSISSGLSTTGLDEPTMARLDAVVRRINSPQLRLQPAIGEIAHLHCQLMTDPVVPSFNGILSRLLLRYHLGRCGLPPVLFDPDTDAEHVRSEQLLLPRLLEMIDASYTMLLAAAN